jgi:hypothetical protein
MSKLSRIIAWAGLGVALLIAAPAAASAATARPLTVCPASYGWDSVTQSCVYVG